MQKAKPQRPLIKMNFSATKSKNEPQVDSIFFQSNLLNHFEQKTTQKISQDLLSPHDPANNNNKDQGHIIFQCKEHKNKAIFVCQDTSCSQQSKQGCTKCMNVYHYGHSDIIILEQSKDNEDEDLIIKKQTAQVKQQFMRFQKMIKVPIETLQNQSTHQSVNEKDLQQQCQQQSSQQQVFECFYVGKVNAQINQTEEKIQKKNTHIDNLASDTDFQKQTQSSKKLFAQKQSQINDNYENQDLKAITKIHLRQNVLQNQNKSSCSTSQIITISQNQNNQKELNNSDQRLISSYKNINGNNFENLSQNDHKFIDVSKHPQQIINSCNQIDIQQQLQTNQNIPLPSFDSRVDQKNQVIFLPTQYLPIISYIPQQYPQNYIINMQPNQVQFVTPNPYFLPQQNIQQNIIQNIPNFQNFTPFNILNSNIQAQINNNQQQIYGGAWVQQPSTFNQNNNNLMVDSIPQQHKMDSYFIQNNLLQNQNEQIQSVKQQQQINANKQSENLNQLNNITQISQQQNKNDTALTNLSVSNQIDIKTCNHNIVNSQQIQTNTNNMAHQIQCNQQKQNEMQEKQQLLLLNNRCLQQKSKSIQAPQNIKIEAIENIEPQNIEKLQQKSCQTQEEREQQSEKISEKNLLILKQEESDFSGNVINKFKMERVQLCKSTKILESAQASSSEDKNLSQKDRNQQQLQSQQIERVQLVPYRTSSFSTKSVCNPNGSKKVSVQYFIDNKCMKSQYTSIDKVVHQHIDYYPQLAFLDSESFLQISVNTFEMKYYLNLVDIKQKKILQRREASSIFQSKNSSIFEENKLVIQKINLNISAVYEKGENQVDFISNQTLKVVKRLKQNSIQKVISYNSGRSLAIASLNGLVSLYNINCNKFLVINQFNVKDIKTKYFSHQQVDNNQRVQIEQQDIINQQGQEAEEIDDEDIRRNNPHYQMFSFLLNCDIFIQQNKLIWCGSSLFKFTYCIIDITSSARMILEPKQDNYPEGILNNDQFKIQISNLQVFNDRVYFEFSYIGRESDQFLNNQNASSVLLQSRYTVVQYKMNQQDDQIQLNYHSLHPNSNLIKVQDTQNQIFLYNQLKSYIIGILFEKDAKKKITQQSNEKLSYENRFLVINNIAHLKSLFKKRIYKEDYEEVKFKMNISQFQNNQSLYIFLNTSSPSSSSNQKFITLVDNKKIFHKVFLSQSQYTTKIK